MAGYELESVDLSVNIASEASLTASVCDAQPLSALVGDAAGIDVGQAITYIKSGQAEVQAKVNSGIAEFNANATAKTTDFNTYAAGKKTEFNDNAASKTNDFNDNADSVTADFDNNAIDMTAAFNLNAINKTDDFDANATNKTTAFNDNASDKTTAFNDNAVAKQALVDASADAAALSESHAATSEENAAASATLAQNWANKTTGTVDGSEYSAKYYAEQAAATFSSLAPVATSGSYNDLTDKPTIGNATLTIQKNSTNVDTFTANATTNKTINITVPTTAADVSALPDSTKYGATIDLSLNTTDYKLTLTLKDQDGTTLNSKTVDFPIESVVVNGSYDATNQKIVLTLQNGNTIDIPVGALVAGLQTEITSTNKLDADLVSDSTSTNKFVTTSDKTTWNGKQDAISDLATIRSGASAGATAVQPADLATVATSGKASDLNNDSGFITGITAYDVRTALGYTPYSASNPAGYTSNVGTVTSVNNVSPANGNVTLTIPAAQVNSDWNAASGVAQILNKPTIGNATLTITQGGATKGTFTANASSDVTIALDAGGGGGATYTAGDGIDITNNVISVDGEQTSEVDTSEFVHIAGAETITGAKTFSKAITTYTNTGTMFTLKCDGIDCSDYVSSTTNKYAGYFDDNGVYLGGVQLHYSAVDSAIRLQLRKQTDTTTGASSLPYIGLRYLTTGNAYGLAPDFLPISDNSYTLGNASYRWKQLFAGTTTISTSDERLKQGIESVPDEVLDAWGEVEFYRYKFNESVEKKGEAARYHLGMIAQRIMQVFGEHGLNARDYGLLCYDEWQAEPAEIDEDGQIVTPAREAGNRYSLRYEECLCMEAAYQRRRADRIEARLAALEARG